MSTRTTLSMFALIALACSANLASAQSLKVTTFCEIDLEQNGMRQFSAADQRPPG